MLFKCTTHYHVANNLVEFIISKTVNLMNISILMLLNKTNTAHSDLFLVAIVFWYVY